MKRYAVTIDNYNGAWRSGVDESHTGPWVKYEDVQAQLAQLRGELTLAEEGLANYAQEVADLRQAYEYHKGNAERFKQRCWSLAVLLYPYDAPREAVAGDLGLPEPQSGPTTTEIT